MTHAIRIHQTGGPEVLRWEEVEVGHPGPGEARVRHAAVGLNFIDVYQRTGLYALPMPLSLGMEGSGIVEAVGPGVTHLKAGDRAAYAANPPGSYSEVRVMPAKNVCKLPDAISFETGAAMMLKGMTAWYLIRRTHVVKPGETILIHAAAGGVEARQDSVRVDFLGEVNRIYFDAPAEARVIEKGRITVVQKAGFADAVVWNPGAAKCATMADLEPED